MNAERPPPRVAFVFHLSLRVFPLTAAIMPTTFQIVQLALQALSSFAIAGGLIFTAVQFGQARKAQVVAARTFDVTCSNATECKICETRAGLNHTVTLDRRC